MVASHGCVVDPICQQESSVAVSEAVAIWTISTSATTHEQDQEKCNMTAREFIHDNCILSPHGTDESSKKKT
jgi:hypothetical protein